MISFLNKTILISETVNIALPNKTIKDVQIDSNSVAKKYKSFNKCEVFQLEYTLCDICTVDSRIHLFTPLMDVESENKHFTISRNNPFEGKIAIAR